MITTPDDLATQSRNPEGSGRSASALPPMCKAVVERLADKKNGFYHRGHGETQSAGVGGMARWPIWSWRSERTISLPAKQLGAPLERSSFWRDDSIQNVRIEKAVEGT